MAAFEEKFGQNAVYGNLAYDFNNPALYPDVEYGNPLEKTREPETAERTAVRTHTATLPRTKQGVSPFAVGGMLVAAVLLSISIMAQVQLMSVSDASVELQSQLSELQTEQTKLQIAYESAFNMAEIEEYAVTELGMQKPNGEQIYYIDTSSPNKAVVINHEQSKSLLDRASDLFSGIASYFK